VAYRRSDVDQGNHGKVPTAPLAHPTKIVLVGVLAAAALTAPLLVRLSPLRINTSPSLPRGLYLLEPVHGAPHPGEMVLACPPPPAAAFALARRYLDPGPCPGGTKPLGKLVLAAGGDRVELSAVGIVLNGCALGAAASPATDTRGRRLPRYPVGVYRVRAQEIWLFSPHRRSFDSRYFGPVSTQGVIGVLRPLLVLPSLPIGRWTAILRSCAPRS
jgi:conjugative transfer signal peptidase TraF